MLTKIAGIKAIADTSKNDMAVTSSENTRIMNIPFSVIKFT
jgi:hypothetical protein